MDELARGESVRDCFRGVRSVYFPHLNTQAHDDAVISEGVPS
jgi:hypothetical protein